MLSLYSILHTEYGLLSELRRVFYALRRREMGVSERASRSGSFSSTQGQAHTARLVFAAG